MNESGESYMDSEARQEYINKLRKWIEDVQKHNQTCFTLWLSYYQQVATAHSTPRVAPATATARPTSRFYVYVIPPMWKRIVAETIDFLILFVIKMLLTIVMLESFDIIEIENYDLEAFHQRLQDPKVAMQMSLEILMLEFIYRIIVCAYETYWLVMQCATPGKRYMGLAVVHVNQLAHIQGRIEETVLACPCTPLNARDAFFRAFLKNIFIGLLLPICFVMLLFKYNRTGYDLMTNSLVVEYNPNPPIHEHHL